ncbi:MAG: kelch repeat-containing protein, partial [Chloroflexota bacterium]
RALDGRYLSDAWLIDDQGTATPIRLAGDPPPARSGAELVADPTHGRLLLFGGRDADAVMNDLWELRLPTP